MKARALALTVLLVAGCTAGENSAEESSADSQVGTIVQLEKSVLDRLENVGVREPEEKDLEQVIGSLSEVKDELLGEFDSVVEIYPRANIENVYERRLESALRDERGLPPFVTESGFPNYLIPEVEGALLEWLPTVVSISWSESDYALEGVSGVAVSSDLILADAEALTLELGSVSSENARMPQEVSVELFDGTEVIGSPETIVRTGSAYWAVIQIDSAAVLKPRPLGSQAVIEIGDPFVAIGHPDTVGRWSTSVGIAELVFSRFDPEGTDKMIPSLDLSNPYYLGMQGGAVLNPVGELVGLIQYGFARADTTIGGPGGVAPSPASDYLFPASPFISQGLAMTVVRIEPIIDALVEKGYDVRAG